MNNLPNPIIFPQVKMILNMGFSPYMDECRKSKLCKINIDSLTKFSITMSKPIEDKFLTLFVFYAMQRFSVYMGLTDISLPKLSITQLPSELIEIPQTFVDEIKINDLFISTLKSRLTSYAEKNGNTLEATERLVERVINVLTTRKIDISRNNSVAKVRAQNRQQKAIDDERKAVLIAAAKKYGNGQKWSYYREYYRGPNTPAHSDDYEGSGEISFEDLVLTLCKSEDDVKKLANAPSKTTITDISGHYRIFYNKK